MDKEIEKIIKKIAYNDIEIELLHARFAGDIIPELVFDIINELKAKL